MIMKSAKIGVVALLGCFAIAVVLASMPINHVSASDGGLNLPRSAIVRIEVFNGTESYFNTLLMDVPSGYDVTNGTYPGWCVDTAVLMSRSPATHDVILYSSLDPPNGTLGDQRWDTVNYILNHKRGGLANIQDAIWYFVDFSNASKVPPDTDTITWEIINDALANGTGYVPAFDQTVAVICVPVLLLPQPTPVQINIIEVMNPVIPEFPTPIISLFMASIVLLAVIVYKRRTLTMHG
jgi:hypothetical protein